MCKIIVIAWEDPEGDVRKSDKLTFDGANYFPVMERCAKRFALVYSHDASKEMKERAETFATDKRQEYQNVKVFILPDTNNVLEVAKSKL